MNTLFKQVRIILSVVLLLGAGQGFAQITTATYVVTTTVSGSETEGSIGYILPLAIEDANAGTVVTIFFNAPGLCSITENLPVISIDLGSTGSITFDKHPSATVEQGLVLGGTGSSSEGIGWALNISDNTSTSFVTVKNISIKEFYDHTLGHNYLTGIYIGNNSNNVTIENCYFENNKSAIDYSNITNNILIQHNIFTDNGGAVKLQCLGNSAAQGISSILTNTVSISSLPFSECNSEIIIQRIDLPTMNHKVEIKTNYLGESSCGAGSINIFNYAPSFNSVIDPTFEITVSNNIILNELIINDPYQKFVIKENTFSSADPEYTTVHISTNDQTPDNIFGLQFINTGNPIGIAPSNYGNIYTGSVSPYGWLYRVEGHYHQGVTLVGHNFPGSVRVEGISELPATYTIIRANRIVATTTDEPIVLDQHNVQSTIGNNGIASPTITVAYPLIDGAGATHLQIEYSLDQSPGSQIVQANGDFAVDFYKSNSNGDLLDYLGNNIITTLNSSAHYQYMTLLSGTVTISNGDRIAGTITAYGNQQDPVSPVGTSKANYFTVTAGTTVSSTVTPVTGVTVQQAPGGLTINFTQNPVVPTPTVSPTATVTPIGYNWGFYLRGPVGGALIDLGNLTLPFPSPGCNSLFLLYPPSFDANAITAGSIITGALYTISVSAGISTVESIFTATYSAATATTTTTIADCAYNLTMRTKTSSTGSNLSYFCVFDPTIYFSALASNQHFSAVYSWNFGDGSTKTGATPTHHFSSTGTYTITLSASGTGCGVVCVTKVISINSCESLQCINCLGSFQPEPGKTYLVSAWVKEKDADVTATSYTKPEIYIEYPVLSSTTTAGPFKAKGLIIDEWQRIEETFTIPSAATTIRLKLNCASGNCFFDDIRIFPTDGSMKSYVYDPVTLRLSAELDERNYATFYEYDEEGKLVRVKKETERGVMTVQENKNSIKKR